MSLWADIPFYFLHHDDPEQIQVEDLYHNIMQGIDLSNRHFLAQKVWYQGEYCVGIIRQRWVNRDDEWEYGVPGKIMDVWKRPQSEEIFLMGFV
jgi:hypothetical protein